MPQPRLHVVAGVMRDEQGRVLLAQRPPGKDLAGSWEFPGGKLEAGESPQIALARELNEELGIRATIGRRRIAIPHGRILLDVHDVTAYEGVPHSRESQALVWIDPARIDRRQMPIADRPVVTSLCLPERYLITPVPEHEHDGVFMTALESALRSGMRLIQLRLPGWSRQRIAPLARRMRDACHAANARLLLNSDWQLAEVLGLDGVHLPAHIVRSLSERVVPQDRLLGVSCHDADELTHAARIGADFATLSPIKPTATHPEAVPLGWSSAGDIVVNAPLPVYALGGLDQSDHTQSFESGFQGIAAIRAFWPRS